MGMDHPVLLDGFMGTLLQSRGRAAGGQPSSGTSRPPGRARDPGEVERLQRQRDGGVLGPPKVPGLAVSQSAA